jgi:hypothetical protein
MNKKLVRGMAFAAAAAALVLPVLGFAQTFTITVPTSTASQLTANVGSQFGDTGTLYVVLVAAGIPLAFYVIKKVIALIPKR